MRIGLGALLLWLLFSHAACAQEFRQWQDSSGRFSVNAKLLRQSDDEVVIETENGREITVPKAKLSEKDVQYLNELVAKPAAPPIPVDGPRVKPGNVVELNTREALQLRTPETQTLQWSPQPLDQSAIVPEARFDFGQVPFPLMQINTGVALDPTKTKAVVSVRPGFGRRNQFAYFHFCDLTTGEKAESGLWIPSSVVASLGNQGSRLLTHSSQRDKQLDLYELEREQWVHRLSWEPWLGKADSSSVTADRISMAELIGSNHVVAVAQGGEVTLWDTAAEKLVWWLQAETYCEPVLSADRTRMIVKQGNRLVCLALPSGDCLGVIPCRDDNAIAMAISPDELHCAVAGAGLLRIYSLETGELESEFAIEGFRLPAGMREYGSKLSWMGDGHLLFAPYDSLYLIDVRLRSRIWEFELEKGFDFSVTASGELFYMAARERSGEIAAVVLPVMNPEWSKQLSEHSPEELVVVEQGTAVRLEVNAVVPKSRIEGRGAGRGDSPVDISQEVYERVAKKLQAAGWVIDPESSLCVYVYTGTPECLPYENIRRFNGGDGISDSGMRKGIVLHDDEFWYWGGLSPITRESGKAILANEDRHDPYFEMGFPFLVVPEVICREPTRGRAAFTFDGMRPGRFGVHERSIFWEKGHPLAEQQ